jgi:catechol 2,3-dioxygenase-like lactoylglutathione lyase family enzyme
VSQGDLGTQTICQVAIVVRDIEEAAAAWAGVFGVETPSASLTDPQEKSHVRYRGEPTEGRAKLAFFQCGGLSLELIEPVGGPSTWQEFLDAHGPGVHHVAFQIQGMDEVCARLDAKGMPTVQRGDYTGGRYGYVDATKQLAVTLELLENLRAK